MGFFLEKRNYNGRKITIADKFKKNIKMDETQVQFLAGPFLELIIFKNLFYLFSGYILSLPCGGGGMDGGVK